MMRVSPSVRLLVRERANERCEYCRKPEQFDIYPFHVDHIIPVKRHGGLDDLINYAWACFNCNTAKGADIASYDFVTNELAPLFNPRNQRWDDHFEFVGALLVAKTSISRVTLHILQMNDPDEIEFRQLLMDQHLW